MPDVPTSVTHDQMTAACELLGLPASDVTRIELDANEGAVVHLRVRNESGHIQADLRGEPLTAVLVLPIAQSRPSRPAPQSDGSPETAAALADYFSFAKWAGVQRSEAQGILHRHCLPGAVLTAEAVTKAGDYLAALSSQRDAARWKKNASL